MSKEKYKTIEINANRIVNVSHNKLSNENYSATNDYFIGQR